MFCLGSGGICPQEVGTCLLGGWRNTMEGGSTDMCHSTWAYILGGGGGNMGGDRLRGCLRHGGGSIWNTLQPLNYNWDALGIASSYVWRNHRCSPT